MSLAFEKSGSGDDVVVLLHGLFGSGRNLATLGKQLAGTHRVYALDLPNHGDSPHEAALDIPSMADRVADTLISLNVSDCKLLGHSLGGKVAMSLALRYPKLVNRLVVVDIAPVTYPPHHSEILTALQSLNLSAVESRSQADKLLSELVEDLPTRQFLLQSLRKQRQSFCWKFNLDELAQSYDHLRAGISLGDSPPFNKLVLLIGGEHSKYIRPENEPAMRELFPQFTYREIAGAGHWPHAEKPQSFNAIVEKFFAVG